MSVVQELAEVLADLIQAVSGGGLQPPLLPAPPTARSATAFAKMTMGDPLDPDRQAELRKSYETAHPFPRPMRTGQPGKPIWEPSTGMQAVDLQAALAVA